MNLWFELNLHWLLLLECYLLVNQIGWVLVEDLSIRILIPGLLLKGLSLIVILLLALEILESILLECLSMLKLLLVLNWIVVESLLRAIT